MSCTRCTKLDREVNRLAINVGYLTKLLVEHGVSCDTCDSQEGCHYCLLHTKQIKNMYLYCCGDWTTREEPTEQGVNND